MLGRKGVLIADPSVAAMTDAQWLFEAYALRKRERQETEQKIEFLRLQRQILVNMLGLDLVKQAGGTGEEIIPLSILCGTPEVMQQVLAERDNEDRATDALNDPEFDKFSEALATGNMDELDLWPMPDEDQVIQLSKSPKISFDDDGS